MASFRKNTLPAPVSQPRDFSQGTPYPLLRQGSYVRGIAAKEARNVRPDGRFMSQPMACPRSGRGRRRGLSTVSPRTGRGHGQSTAVSLQWPQTLRNKATHRTGPRPQQEVSSPHNVQDGLRRSRFDCRSAAPASISCSPDPRSALQIDPCAASRFLLGSFRRVRSLAAGKCESGNPRKKSVYEVHHRPRGTRQTTVTI